METLQEKAKRLGIKPAGQPATSTVPQGETLQQKAQRLGMKPATPSAPTAPVRTTKDKWGDRAMGFTQSLLGTAVGTAKMFQTAGQGVMAALHPTKTFADIHEQYGLKSLKNNTEEGQSVTRSLTPNNKEQEQGKLVGDIAQYLVPASKVNTATAALPWLQRTALRTAPDILTSIAQNQGAGLDSGETSKNAGITALTSGVANALLPGKPVSKTSEFLRTLAPGYVADVATGLAGQRGEDRQGAKAFIPGVGTAISGTIGTVQAGGRAYSDAKTGVNTINKRTETLADLEKKYKKVQKAFVAGDKKGVDVRKILSETDLLNGAVDADGHISKEIAMQNFDEVMAPWEGKVREKLVAEGAKVSTQRLTAQADDFVRGSRLLGSDKTKLRNQILADLQALSENGNTVMVPTLHDLKVQRGGRNNYLDPDTNAVNKEVTRFFKEMVEKNTKALDVPTYNSELSKLYAVRDALESLDRTKVKGARLGKYFSQVIGAAAGGSVGGPLGAILGAEAGDLARGAQLSRSLGGDINTSLAPSSRMIDALTPKATGKEAIPSVVMPRSIPVTGQSSKSGSLKITQSNTMIPTNIPHRIVIPKTVSSSKPSATKLPTEGKEMFAGIGLGFEKDENGEITFNEDKALAGMIGVAGLSRSQAIQKLSKDLDLGTRKIMSDFVDAVRLNMTTKGGQFTFKNAETMTGEEAQKAFDEGLKLIQGEMGRGLKNEKIQQTLPKTLGIFYEDVIGASGKQQAGKVLPSRISTNLVAEAKKYKSAEEFVKAQGTPVYHGTSAKFDEFRSDLLGVNTNAGSAREGFFFATSKENALHYKPNTRVANPDVAKSLNKDLIANLAKKGLKTRVELPNSSLGYYQPTVVTPQRLTLDDFGSRLNGDIKEQWLNQGIADLETKKRLISRNSSDEKWFDDVIATYKETVKDSLISKKSSTSDRGELKVVYLNYKNPKILTDNRTIEGGRDLNFKDEIKKAKEEGYDAVIIKNTKDPLPTDVHVVFSAEQIKTKSQLTDIWEKANK